MPGVQIKEGESFERALKRFSKIIEKEGILSEVKKNQFYEKPSERKKRKMNTARRKQLIKARRAEMPRGGRSRGRGRR